VAIVRALAVHPRALLLDEITSALDPELVGEVLRVAREVAAEGMTILMATHEMGFARQVTPMLSRAKVRAGGALSRAKVRAGGALSRAKVRAGGVSPDGWCR
jgi:ABC-type polar amino acid transport system ATPase subunit